MDQFLTLRIHLNPFMRYYFSCALLAVSALLWLSCNKITPFGSELLEDQLGDYLFTDTLTVRCTVEREDEVFTSDRSASSPYLLCGTLNDPEFGKTTAEIYTLAGLPPTVVRFDKIKVKIDSIVLLLGYDADGTYGDTLSEHILRFHQLSEPLQYTGDYKASSSIPTRRLLGEKRFFPRPSVKDSLAAGQKAPFLRMRLDTALARDIIGLDSLPLTRDTAFYTRLKGFKITCTPAGGGSGAMLGFDLNDETYSMIRLYYREDTVKKQYNMRFAEGREFSLNKFSNLTHDYAGAPAEKAIGQANPQLMYLQGAKGLRVKVELPHVDALDNIAVNKAELVLTALTPSSGAFRLSKQLALTEERIRNLTRSDSILVRSLNGNYDQDLTSDMYVSLGPNLDGGLRFFGGQPLTQTAGTQTVQRYRLSLTDRFQSMVDDTQNTARLKTLYLKVHLNRTDASRAILYGPGSTIFPAKIELKYTKVR